MRETYILCTCILYYLCVGHLLVFWYCGHVLDIFVLWTCAFIYIYLCCVFIWSINMCYLVIFYDMSNFWHGHVYCGLSLAVYLL